MKNKRWEFNPESGIFPAGAIMAYERQLFFGNSLHAGALYMQVTSSVTTCSHSLSSEMQELQPSLWCV